MRVERLRRDSRFSMERDRLSLMRAVREKDFVSIVKNLRALKQLPERPADRSLNKERTLKSGTRRGL